jgi:D-aminoacyl-tRNA deacylase
MIFLAIMKYVLLASSKDKASCTMRDYLMEHEGFTILTSSYSHEFRRNYKDKLNQITPESSIGYEVFKSKKYENIDLLSLDHELVSLPNLDELVSERSLLIFLSKHASKSKLPALTSHFTGNFSSSNSLGGSPFELGIAYPTFQKEYMKNLVGMKSDLQQYDLTIEATHHGPTSSTNPIMFVEIGSSDEEWENRLTASLVCKCLLQTIEQKSKYQAKKTSKIAIGLGGNHYSEKFNKLIISSDVAFASIASKHNLRFIDKNMLNQMRGKSIEQVTDIYFDKKSLGSEKHRLISISEDECLTINFV